jgi:hypothetical protein
MHSIARALLPMSLATAAIAQIPLNGSVYDGHGGPLLAGNVYHCTGDLAIPAGQTLTIERGAIVKMSGAKVSAQGTLLVGGGPAAPGVLAVITSIHDDSAGGDTNGNGTATTPAPGDWRLIAVATTGSASVLDHLEVRYAGGTSPASVQLPTTGATLSDCWIHDGLGVALDLGFSTSPITNCRFEDCDAAVNNVRLWAVPGINGCTASGNLTCNSLAVAGHLTGGMSPVIGPANLFQDSVLLWDMNNHLAIDATSSLDLLPGVVWKSRRGTGLQVNGILRALGTAQAPVVFTSYHDDSVGGDTDLNGPTTGNPGDWYNLYFSATADRSVLEQVRVAYGGSSQSALVTALSGITMRHCSIEHGQNAGMTLGLQGMPVVEHCAFLDNQSIAMTQVLWHALPGFLDNTASGNLGGDYFRVAGSVAGSVEVWPWNYPGDTLVASSVNVPVGATLRLHAGMLVKIDQFSSSPITGTLDVDGDGLRPVVFTSIDDDSIGGDTGKDGPPGPNGPLNLGFFDCVAGASMRMHHAMLRYWRGLRLTCNGYDVYGVRCEQSNADAFLITGVGVISQCAAWNSHGHGFVLTPSAPGLRLVHCTSVGNGAYGFTRSTQPVAIMNSIAWGNPLGDFHSFSTTDVTFSCGLNAPQPATGNQNVDPQFVDWPNGDLRLQSTSSVLNAAFGNPGPPLPIVDLEENSRLLDSEGTLFALPDMGAYERANWQLHVDGDVRPGHALEIECSGLPGTYMLLLGLDTYGISVQPFGYCTIAPLWPSPWALLGMFATGPGGHLTLPIPAVLPAGVPVHLQGVASNTGFASGSFTNRCRRTTHSR